MHQHDFPGFWNYIDDHIYTGLPSKIYQTYQFLLELLQDLGLTISQEKLIAPTTSAICLDILMDTKARTISIPNEKLLETKLKCTNWVQKNPAPKILHQFQSLLGCLLYITKCIKPRLVFFQ